MKSLFITLEGPEGSGKTTQAKQLSKYLEKKGFRTIISREPGGTKIGQQLRKLLLSPASKNMEILTELFLYLAVRAEHVAKVIKPALAEGKIVISDRFFDATVAYQAYGRGIDKNIIDKLNLLVTRGLKPDLTLLLDIEIPTGIKRARGNGAGDRIEQEGEEFHQKVREGYLELAKHEPERIKLIVVEGSIGSTQEKLRKYINELLAKQQV